YVPLRPLHSFPTRRSSDLLHHRLRGRADPAVRLPRPVPDPGVRHHAVPEGEATGVLTTPGPRRPGMTEVSGRPPARGCNGYYGRSEEHTSELQSRFDLVCR